MKWLETKIILDNKTESYLADVIADIFTDMGLQGVVIDDPDMSPEEGWADNFEYKAENLAITGFFPKNELVQNKVKVLEDRLLRIKQDFGLNYTIILREIDEEDWAHSWKDFFWPHKITEHIIVKPTWREYEAVPGDIVLEIDPGMAFGTGIHPTSAECIKMLKTFLKPEDRMLDIGTGSGILMLAGAKLGASKVVGVDSDEVATETARRNLLHNKIDPKKFNILNGNLVEPVKGLYDIVVANILSEVIISLLDHIHKVLDKGGIIIASGIIEKNKKDVIEKMVYNNLDVIKVVIKDGWTTIAARSCIK